MMRTTVSVTLRWIALGALLLAALGVSACSDDGGEGSPGASTNNGSAGTNGGTSGTTTTSGNGSTSSNAATNAATNGATTGTNNGSTGTNNGSAADVGDDAARDTGPDVTPDAGRDAEPPEDAAPDVPVEPDTSEEDAEPPCTTTQGWADLDGDGQGDPNQVASYCLEQGPGDGVSDNPFDCDDSDPQVYTGQRRCAPDGAGIEICGNGQFRPVETCGFERACFTSPAGPRCGCEDPDARRCEEWYVRLCAPNGIDYITQDCRPDDCADAACPGCTIAFAYRDADADGQGDLHNPLTYCTEDGPPAGYTTANATDCRDDDPNLGDGALYCNDTNIELLQCQNGWAVRVEQCFNGCTTTGPGQASCN